MQALLCAGAEAVVVVVLVVVVVVVVVVVAVLVAVQDRLVCAELVRRGISLQRMRLVVMELHFLRLFLAPLPFVGRRRQVPLLLLLPLFEEPIQTIPQPFFLYFRTEQVDLSCHLCTYSTFKGPSGVPTAHVRGIL